MPTVEETLQACETQLNYQFCDRELLRRCLTHSSAADTRLDSNERLEFLGDSILGLVVCEHLFRTYPQQREGQLTQMKSQVVSRQTCARVASQLGLKELILVGKGLLAIPDSIIAAAIESLIAGIFLDGGLESAREFVLRAFSTELQQCQALEAENYKSQLQEFTQRELNTTPEYLVVEERGPDHAREFFVAARVGIQTYSAAWGRSKKEAEQQAARLALEGLAQPPAVQPETD